MHTMNKIKNTVKLKKKPHSIYDTIDNVSAITESMYSFCFMFSGYTNSYVYHFSFGLDAKHRNCHTPRMHK